MMNSGSEKEAVLAAIYSVIALNEEAGVSSDSLSNVLETASQEKTKALFHKFSNDIMKLIHDCFQHFGSVLPSLAKVRAHKDFHQARLQAIPTIWKSFTDAAGINIVEPLNLQAVSQQLFTSCMKQFFDIVRTSTSAGTSRANEHFLADEENVLRYVSGSVVMKLLKKIKKPTATSIKDAQFLECLSQMSNRDEDSPCSDYTLEWTDSLSRGKLLVVNESTFTLFKAVEAKTRQALPSCLTEDAPSKKIKLIEAIANDRMVQMHWQRVGNSVIDDTISQELLKMLVDMWVTMRGFALTSKWMEEYKLEKEKALKKSKSLRKELNDNN